MSQETLNQLNASYDRFTVFIRNSWNWMDRLIPPTSIGVDIAKEGVDKSIHAVRHRPYSRCAVIGWHDGKVCPIAIEELDDIAQEEETA